MNFWRHLEERYSEFIPTVLTLAPTWVSKRKEPFPATAEGFFIALAVAITNREISNNETKKGCG
jgi:hypothetical protein